MTAVKMILNNIDILIIIEIESNFSIIYHYKISNDPSNFEIRNDMLTVSLAEYVASGWMLLTFSCGEM